MMSKLLLQLRAMKHKGLMKKCCECRVALKCRLEGFGASTTLVENKNCGGGAASSKRKSEQQSARVTDRRRRAIFVSTAAPPSPSSNPQRTRKKMTQGIAAGGKKRKGRGREQGLRGIFVPALRDQMLACRVMCHSLSRKACAFLQGRAYVSLSRCGCWEGRSVADRAFRPGIACRHCG